MKNILVEMSSIAYFESEREARAWADNRFGKRSGYGVRRHYDLGGVYDIVPPAPDGVNKIRWMTEAEGARR